MSIYHHGIKGQKWGVRNGPPYPLKRYRRATAKDLNAIYDTLSDDDKYKVTGEKMPSPSKFVKNDEELAQYFCYAIVETYKDVPVSAFMWQNWHGEQTAAEVITRSGEQYRGKGYATDVAKRGKEWFDRNPKLKEAFWDVAAENKASIHIAEKLGYAYNPSSIAIDRYGTKWVSYEYRKPGVKMWWED